MIDTSSEDYKKFIKERYGFVRNNWIDVSGYERLVQDIRAKLRYNLGYYPEFTEAKIFDGRWYLFFTDHGWIEATRALTDVRDLPTGD